MKITVLRTILESLISFLSNNQKKTLQNLVHSVRKAASKLELSEKQFERTVKDKLACKTHLENENDYFKHNFEILDKFPIK